MQLSGLSLSLTGGGGVSLLSQVLAIPGLLALYDPSDTTSLYQSRTGGTTGVADAVVGIMLDKSQMGPVTAAAFIVGQTELRSTGVTDVIGTATAATYSTTTGSGTARREDDAGNQSYVVFSGLSASRFYLIDIENTGAAALLIRSAITGTTISGAILAGTRVTVIGLSSSGGQLFVAANNNNSSIAFTVHSVKYIPGNHAVAPSDAARPILRTGVYVDFDTVDDVLNAVIAANLGSSCSVYHRTQAGANVWLDAQTISAGNYALSTTDWKRAAIFSSLPTADQKATVEAWGAS